MHRLTFPIVILGAFAPPVLAQGLDLTPLSVLPNQAVQDGTSPFIAGRSICVRVPVAGLGTIPPGAVYDGVLRVYAGGVELPESPFYSANGPLPVTADPSLTTIDGTLNFAFLPPQSNNVVIEVEINPSGPTQIAETDYTNNVLSVGPLEFVCKAVPQCTFVPIDYRPGGGGPPNPPAWDLIRPGVGDNFIQAIYPVPDWEYNRIDAPAKLWTSSVASSGGGVQLAQELANDMLLMDPVPDFIYGWIPGALPGYNGVALSVPGVAAVGNTEPIRHQRTFAHEVGHLFGLFHNTSQIGTAGLDVEHHLNITESLPMLQPTNKNDIMVAGLLTNQAFVRPASYNFFAGNSALDCAAPDGADDGERLIVSGLFDHATHALTLTDTLVVDGGRQSKFVPLEEADVVLQAFDGETALAQLGISTRSSADSCPECGGNADEEGGGTTLGGFAAALPTSVQPDEVERIEISLGAGGPVLLTLDRSEHAPVAGSFTVGTGTASWEASDADGDALTAYVRYSPDGERLVPLASGVLGTQAQFDATSLAAPEPGGYFELLVSDGLHTTAVRTAVAAEGGGGNPPMVGLLSPDTGFTFPEGATVILHSSGWDIEDRSLTGASITWSSDLDGALGTGRVTAVADLSVGTHTITVTATDSSSSTASDSVTIEVTARELPGLGTCQTDLGFGGPGSSVLEVCGGDLSTGTTADVSLSGAAPSAAAFFMVGFTQNPTSLLGGTIIPVPPAVVVSATTDAGGSVTLPSAVTGGGATTIYMQAAYLDAGQPQGVGISNAVQVDLLP